MSASRHLRQAPKSKARKNAKNHWIRFEEIANGTCPFCPARSGQPIPPCSPSATAKPTSASPATKRSLTAEACTAGPSCATSVFLWGFGLIEKEHRFYDDDVKREYGGQRSNKYWFVSFSPQDVTPRMTAAPPLTRDPSKQIYTKTIQESTEVSEEPCDHPWGNPMDYPHEGFWRCSLCGDPYKRYLRRCSQDEGKKDTPKRQKKAPARHPGRRSRPRCILIFSVLLGLIDHQCPLTQPAPPPRVDTKDTAIAESGVATLDWVAVSGRKRG